MNETSNNKIKDIRRNVNKINNDIQTGIITIYVEIIRNNLYLLGISFILFFFEDQYSPSDILTGKNTQYIPLS